MCRMVVQSVSTLLAVALVCTSVSGAESAPKEKQPLSPAAIGAKSVPISGADGVTESDRTLPPLSLGRSSSSSISPGKLIGDTWYDYQHNGSMGRMVDWGWDDSNQVLVHFTWMRQWTYPSSGRGAAYNCYYSVQDTMLGQTSVQQSGGYANLDAAADNRAVISVHTSEGSCVYWDFAPGFGFFGEHSCVPDSVGTAIWPKMRYHDIPGQSPVTHVFSQVSEPGAGDGQAIHYYRKVGVRSAGVWDYPPYVVDTVFDIAQDVACSQIDGRMALVWVANLPDPGDCDTCSSQTGWPFVQWDNDVYYQVSYDYGATFEPRVNVTMNVDGEEGYRPYTDLSALIGSDNNLRIGWSGRYWPADANSGGQAGLLRCRMFYWGENLGIGGFDGGGDAIIRTAANLEWDQVYCNGGAWQLNGSKMSLSECDGKLYYLWVQFNDIPNGVEDDCHERAWQGDVVGAANGELFLAVSDDGGFAWDLPRNLTNTYTPHCDSANGAGGQCQSEHWPSMAPIGTDLPFPGAEFVVVDPSDGYTGDYFLDVQYIDDPDPGGIVQDEGTWQQTDVRWFRLPCVEPVPVACVTPGVLYLNEYTFHGEPVEVPLVLENQCNTDASFSLTIVELSGPEGWLTTSGFESGFLPLGDGRLEGTVTMNTGGIVNSPGTSVHLQGGLLFEGNFLGSPLSIGISCWVIPPFVPQWRDTVQTSCLALAVKAGGNYGNQGMGKVNMDFFNYGDCDDLEGENDTIPGDATIYLYDGSPVICWPDGDSVLCNWSIFGTSLFSDNGFLPVSEEPTTESGDFYYYQSTFTTRDAGIGVQQSWYAPKNQTDTCQFLIHRLRVFSNDGQTHSGVTIGEAIDWDIPSDTASRNNSGFDWSNRLIYQSGSEYNDDDDVECMDNDDRYGGIKLLEILEFDGVDTVRTTDFWGAYTEDNPTWVYPSGGFVPEEIDSLMNEHEGIVIESDSLDTDLHTVMTFRNNYQIGPSDTLDIFATLVSSRSGYADFLAAAYSAQAWYVKHVKLLPCGCCLPPYRGNINYDPYDQIDISDLVYLVDYMFNGGPAPTCWAEANVDASGDGNCDDVPSNIDIADLVYLVDYMFAGYYTERCP